MRNGIFRFIPWFFGFVFAVVLTGWIAVGVIAYFSISQVSENGISGVAEKLWCGKKPDCKLGGQ